MTGFTNLAKTTCNTQKSFCDAGTIGNDGTHQCEPCIADYANTEHSSCVAAINCGVDYYGDEATKQCTLCAVGWMNIARTKCNA